MDNGKIIEVLRSVPAKKLLIIELANQVPIKHGDLDPDYLISIQPQVNLAIAEAETYTRHTQEAVAAVMQLPATSADIRPLTGADLRQLAEGF